MCLLALLLLCGGCDSSRQFEQVQKSIDSWSATLDLTGEQWAGQRIPDTYVRQIVEAAGKALDEEEKRLKKISADPSRRQQMERRLAEVRQRLHELSRAVENSNHESAAALSGRVARQTMADSAGGRS